MPCAVPPEAPRDCPICPRLAAFRAANRASDPAWFNGAVPSFLPGSNGAGLIVVGLAPGLRGANRTGRPFTGDYAGDLLYETLLDFGFARGKYDARADDGLQLVDCLVTNAVRCVPPENKPTPAEIGACRPFLASRIEAGGDAARCILALGRIAHDSTLAALGARKAAFPFAHGACHDMHPAVGRPLVLFDSYHCSRYNTNTRRLTRDMFRAVFAAIRAHLQAT